jgi:hypothetical protein
MDLNKLIPSRNNFGIYELKPSEVPDVRRELANARREVGQKDQVFSSAKVLTLVVWPQIKERRRAHNLLACSDRINPILQKTKCTIYEDNVVESYVSGRYIERFDQSHLCEHIALPYLKLAQLREADIDAESAVLDDLGLGKIVTVFTGRYNHAILKDILSFGWHWVGRAITRGDFPKDTEFEKMLFLRLMTIENTEVNLNEVQRILTAK